MKKIGANKKRLGWINDNQVSKLLIQSESSHSEIERIIYRFMFSIFSIIEIRKKYEA